MVVLMKRRLNLQVAWGLIILLLIVAGMPGPVKAAEPVTIRTGSPSEPAVALTFDDGPCSRYTPKILALLRQYQARATFFVLGCKVEKCPWLIKAMLRGGHEVGNHSFSHPRLTKTDQPARERELETTRLDLDLLGCPRERQLIRPPYSDFDNRLVSYAANTGRHLVLWNIDSGDWRGLDSPAIVKNVLSRVRNGSIIIFHDSDERDKADRSPTVEALKIILPVLQAEGYRLVTVSELMAGNATLARRPRGLSSTIH
jgi:peptidoglycan/xylan/chitin deacetylase (PgdA/CDA1 family)